MSTRVPQHATVASLFIPENPHRVLVLLSALLMPAVAWMANAGMLGPDNTTISNQYPTLRVTVGYAFSIWGLIFLWDIAFAAWQLRASGNQALLDRVRPAAAAGLR